MKHLFNKSDLIFLVIFITLIFRQIFHKGHKDDFSVAICSFTFNFYETKASIYIVLIISLVIPTLLLYLIFHDIHRNIYPLGNFFYEVFIHHLFFGFIAGCTLYIYDIIKDYYTERPTAILRYSEWHKYIFHFILTPSFFVDSVYSIEIQKIIQNGEDEPNTLRSKVYFLFQVVLSCYLIYCLCVVLHIEGELNEVKNSILELRKPDFPSGFAFYIKNLSESAIECVFLTLFFGLIDQGFIFKKFSLFNTKRWLERNALPEPN